MPSSTSTINSTSSTNSKYRGKMKLLRKHPSTFSLGPLSSSLIVMSIFLLSAPLSLKAFSQPPPLPTTFVVSKNNQHYKRSNKVTCVDNANGQCNQQNTALYASTTEVNQKSMDSGASSSLSSTDNNGNDNLRYKNRPIVLIGCSGENNEIPRLASALVEALSQSSSATSEEKSEDIELATDDEDSTENEDIESNKGGVVEVIHSDADGDFVFATQDLRNLILGEESSDNDNNNEAYISGQDVIVLDYAHPLFQEEEGKASEQLTAAYNDNIKVLYEELNCLCIYINVHPDAGQMQTIPKKIRETLEESIFIPYTDYELALKDEGLSNNVEGFENAKWEINRIISRAYLPRPIPGEDGTYTLNSGAIHSCNDAKLMIGGANTFFLSLSFPVITHLEPYIASLCKDNDSMEFRADLLSCRDDRHAILHSQFQLRSMCRQHATRAPVLPFGKKVLDDALPMVYTVRTAGQAGTYPDQSRTDIENMFGLLRLGVRGAAEIMDVESAWDKDLTDSLLTDIENKYSCLVLGSHHVVPEEVSPEEAIKLFQQCALDGRANGAKVVLSIQDPSKDAMAAEAADETEKLAAEAGQPVIPGISLILGEIGVRSRILNKAITPVTHPALPFVAAPGQLSSAEIMEQRISEGMVPSKAYAILGHNIAYSVSPQMQGGAFAATGLPHTYGRVDVETVDELINGDLWNSDNFGGLSITIPHKQTIIPFIDVMSDAATSIGAVNTLTVQYEGEDKKRVMYGDNTDWRGIYNPLLRRLSGEQSGGYALILGGGGTARAAAYAAQQLGLKRIYYNRTTKKAQDLADSFGGVVVTDLSSDDSDGCLGAILSTLESKEAPLQVVISTLPGGAGFELPEWIVSAENKPVIFDVNYKPYWTKLLYQAEKYDCDFVRGSEMLWEQGVGQFEIWTGRTAPYKVMKDVVLANCLPTEEKKE